LSLVALTQAQPDGTAPFMEATALCDPWGHEYMYQYPAPHNSKPNIYSWGPRMHDPNGVIGDWQ
jgi:hypothetical protein